MHFSGNPVLVSSPGRINLIGEHTDYNEGFVLPGAIDRSMIFAIAPNNTGTLKAWSVDMEEYFETAVGGSYQKTGRGWPDYMVGVLDAARKRGIDIGGCDVAFSSDIPVGAGLSSSAALECGLLFGLNELFGLYLEREEIARMGREAENNFVGVQSGIMDQFVNLHGEEGRLVRLDCRSLEYELVPIGSEDMAVVLCDTNVRRELADSEYNIRRQQCEQGVAFLNSRYGEVRSLRDVDLDMLRQHMGAMDPVLYKRCSYVVRENERVLESCRFLKKGDYRALGKQLWESHRGLQYDYEVSCRELDILVDAAMEQDGIYGARMMGGGFGGCTINLLEQGAVEDFKDHISAAYEDKAGREPDFYEITIAQGTHLI